MKKKIQLTESQLNKLIMESVKQVLNETSGDINVYQTLVDAADKLWQVKQSGLIAFTSPNPSSTELQLKQYVEKAEAFINMAMKLYEQLYRH